MLGQVASDFKLGDKTIRIAQVAGEIFLLQLSFASYDLLYFLGKGLVSFFFAVEELGALGCIVYNLRNLQTGFSYS